MHRFSGSVAEAVKEWWEEHGDHIEDRDLNASRNIEAEGMRIAWETLPRCGDLALASLRNRKAPVVRPQKLQ